MGSMALPLFLALALFASEAPVAEAWVVEGQISGNPHAHPIDPQPGKAIAYLDTVAEGQLVVYVKAPVPERGAWVRLSGKALEFETTSPRPGSTKKFKVRQLDVEKVERLTRSDAVQALVNELGAKGVTPERRPAIEEEILRAGKDAFPVLIVNRREEDRELLYRLLLPPDYVSPHRTDASPRTQMLSVADWAAWWRRHRGESLEEIHEGLKPKIDEYYKTGKTQLVD